jgi:hypothetical protein
MVLLADIAAFYLHEKYNIESAASVGFLPAGLRIDKLRDTAEF